MKYLAFLITFLSIFSHASIEKYFKAFPAQEKNTEIKNIDFIYLINLDHRPEKLRKCLEELAPYGIHPKRFPAVNGWNIPLKDLNEMGLKYLPGMYAGKEHANYFPINGSGFPEIVHLNSSCYGKTYFSGWMTRGAIGCALSHLSVIKHAYDSGYNTIWILEDDILACDNPHKLTELIDKLDHLREEEGWDLLYTDYDSLAGIDPKKSLEEQLPMKWRPDMPYICLSDFLENTDISEDFAKIGSRIRTHSMILRRSGMEKILDFYKDRGIFIPYDHEISFVPDMRFYVLKHNIVTSMEAISDTKNWFYN